MAPSDDTQHVPTMAWEPGKVCPECGGSFDASLDVCPNDGAPLEPEGPRASTGSLSSVELGKGRPTTDLLVGQLIRDKWRVLERIGAGSFGTVYKVEDVRGGWTEALKILHVDKLTGADAENARSRFLREARIMKRLGTESPHIVGLNTYEEDLAAGRIYFTMELVEGKSLARILGEEGPFPLERALRLALQACDALSAAHEGPDPVVHRDLKLENLMLTRDRAGREVVKVLDFGIAKIAEREHDSRLTTVGTLGTPGYAAPEQLRAQEVDARTDLFAFGVILYALLTGVDPWLGLPASQPTHLIYELMVQSERGVVKPMGESGVEIPPPLEAIVMKLLRREPNERFASARELREAILQFSGTDTALFDRRANREPARTVLLPRTGRPAEPRGDRREQEQPDRRVEPRAALSAGTTPPTTSDAEPRPAGRRRAVALAAGGAALVVLALTGILRPWGRTLDLEGALARARSGSMSGARLVPGGIEGSLSWGPIGGLPFRLPLGEAETVDAAARLAAAGVGVDATAELDRLVAEAARAQAQNRYYGSAGDDVRSWAQRAAALDPASREARSLLLKVAERLAWDADRALQDGAPEEALRLAGECLAVVPGYPSCAEVVESLSGG